MVGNVSLVEFSKVFDKEGNEFSLRTGINNRLAQKWAELVGSDQEVRKWTSDSHKRNTPEEILERNQEGSEKRIITYSIWDKDNNLAGVAWYQIWIPGEIEQTELEKYYKQADYSPDYLVTTAFRVFSGYRGKGLAGQLMEQANHHYSKYLTSEKEGNILLTLETDEGNHAAVGLYTKQGYSTIAMFDQDKPEDHGKRLLMVKKLKSNF